jgi:hypothetical protein
MRTLRPGVALTVLAFGAVSMTAPTLLAQDAPAAVPAEPPQNDLYPATLDFGTGLIDIPVAWVSPTNGDLWVQTSAKHIPYNKDGQAALNMSSQWNTNLSIDTHWAGRYELGFSAYSQNPEWGFFGQALLLKEQQGKSWPAIAVGFRNLGSFTHEDRMLVGHDVVIDPTGNGADVTSPFARHFHTTPTLYAVATKSFMLSATSDASVTLGYGDGLFSDDGDLGSAYNDKGTIAKGLFLGGRYAIHPSPNTRIDFLAENNGWDWNAGVVGTWRGISLGLYGTELEEGGKSAAKGPLYTVYNYTKMNVSLGYSGNLFAIAEGTLLRSRVAELQREQTRLHLELAKREERITGLEDQLRKAQAGELAEVAKRRQQLESEIQGERDAIQRAEDRLKALQQGQQKPPDKPPQSPPPPPPPPASPQPPAR